MTLGALPRFALPVVLGGLALVGAGCSSGGTVGSTGFACTGDAINAICLQSCNLGCSATGCSRTDIAQNEIVILVFSEAIDPNSVNSSSIRFRTPTGDLPVGEFFVNGNVVEFSPTLSISGGQTFFGFTTGETYTMTIVGGANQPEVVRGTSGRPFEKTVTCTLQSTRGIIDLNGVPPRATLTIPTANQLTSAPRETDIQLEFNELIDATPFLSGTQSPVVFTVRRNRPAAGGGFECDPASQPQTLTGTQSLSFDAARGVSVLSFRPTQPLPGNVCVEISVTDGVTDLSGKPAQPQTFSFRTVVVPLAEFEIVEEFQNDDQLDVESSAARWGGDAAQFLAIGGDGRHGEFSTSLFIDTGTFVEGKRVFEVNCDNTIIPAANTTTGAQIAVTDGRFFFTKMVVPSDVRLRFTGNSPPVISVAGRCDILGDLDVTGGSQTTLPATTQPSGQLGAPGGVFGGAGGAGGARSLGLSPATAVNNGQPGENARLVGGHGYFGSTSGTGGAGSTIWPTDGLNASQQFGTNPPAGLMYCVSASAGGGGGGLWTPGEVGRVVSNNHGPFPGNTAFMGPNAGGGSAVQLFPFPPVTGQQRSSLHFLVGGAGGGGAASNATLSLSLSRNWAPGAGGGGGGGALALRAGQSLRIGPTGRLLATGGRAADNIGSGAGPQVAPGGGGSGGSIVLQGGNTAELIGAIDVRGGAGGNFQKSGGTGGGAPPAGAVVNIVGGAGSPGFVRFELPTAPTLAQLVSMQPPAAAQNVGALTESDLLVSCRSRWYSTQLIFGPEFARYEIYATVDGAPRVYSDDPAVPDSVEAGTGQALRVLFQAANLDLITGEPTEIRQWRNSVRSSPTQTGIASDGLNGFRFMLFFDRMFASTLTIERVVVVYRN